MIKMGDEYQTTSTITNRLSYEADEFFSSGAAQSDFEDLVDRLEEESRGLIESYMVDVTFNEELGKTVEKFSPDTQTISLAYPVKDVSKVEYKTRFGADWKELDSDKYDHDKHVLKLYDYPALYYRGTKYRHPQQHYRIEESRITWKDFSRKLRITYDREGTIPNDVKNIQIDMINKMLRKMRFEQSITAIDPGDPNLDVPSNDILTEDIRRRLDNITSRGRTTLVI